MRAYKYSPLFASEIVIFTRRSRDVKCRQLVQFSPKKERKKPRKRKITTSTRKIKREQKMRVMYLRALSIRRRERLCATKSVLAFLRAFLSLISRSNATVVSTDWRTKERRVRSFREEEDDEKGERDDDDARSVSKRRRRRCFSVGISFLGRRSKEMQSLLRGRFCGNT